jgi:putative tricarboxylic transport membrane protein
MAARGKQMLDVPEDRAQPSGQGIIKSQVDLAAGLLLIAISLVAVFGSLGLRFGQLTSVGPALMPRSIAILVGAFGAGLVITSFLTVGPRLERWHLRGPFFVLGAVLLFALTIRGSTLTLGALKIVIPQLGLAIAGPLTVLFCSLADRDTKPAEVLVFTVLLTIACIGMFKFLLRLPIPILPLGWGSF